MSKNTERKHSIADVLRRLFSYNGKLKLPMAVALSFAALGAVLTIIGPSFLSQITDLIESSGKRLSRRDFFQGPVTNRGSVSIYQQRAGKGGCGWNLWMRSISSMRMR